MVRPSVRSWRSAHGDCWAACRITSVPRMETPCAPACARLRSEQTCCLGTSPAADLGAAAGSRTQVCRRRAERPHLPEALTENMLGGRACRERQRGDQFFVSYSSMDGSEFALRFADRLAVGPPPYTA